MRLTKAQLFTNSFENQNIGIQNLPYKFLSLPKPTTESKSGEDKEGAENDATSNNSESHTNEESSKITEVIRNVRWLISEGYVTEYSDGKLLIHPKAEVNHSIKNKDKNTSKESSQSVDNAEPSTDNINAPEEKKAVKSDSEASSSPNCSIVQETENNNLEEKSTKETTAE